MSWTAPKTWVSGDVLTAAQLNTHLRDNILETAPAKVTTAGDIVYATGANALARLAATAYRMPRANSAGNAIEYVASLNLAQAPIYATVGSTNLTSSQYSALGTGQAITTVGGIVIALSIVAISEVKSGAASALHVAGISRKTSAYSSGADASATAIGSTPNNLVYIGAASTHVSQTTVLFMDTPAANTYYYVPVGFYNSSSTSGTPTATAQLLLVEFAP